jgi:hypothetical protein
MSWLASAPAAASGKAAALFLAEQGVTPLPPPSSARCGSAATSNDRLGDREDPLRRCGELAEAAQMVAWIVSPTHGFTSGFTFDLSGGRATYWQPRLKHPLRSSTGRLI